MKPSYFLLLIISFLLVSCNESAKTPEPPMVDGKIDDYDKTDIGNPFPWLTYGLNMGAEYRGWDLQIFLQGVFGNEIYNAVRHRTEGTGNEATLSTTMRDVWVDYSDVMKASMESYGVDWTELINTDGTIPNPNACSAVGLAWVKG